jgi:hypothetical protein
MKERAVRLFGDSNCASFEVISSFPNHPRAENSKRARAIGLVLLLKVRTQTSPGANLEEEIALFGDLDTGDMYWIPLVED